MKGNKGITLLALVITIIIMLLLVGITIHLVGGNGIIKNTEEVIEQSKIESIREEIELAIAKKMAIEDNDITIEQIIEQLEKQGTINEGDSNQKNGQVKTQPDGYIYKIKKDENGKWEVKYIGQGEIDNSTMTISITGNTTVLTSKVALTISGSASKGITEFSSSTGTTKTYADGTTSISETCEITKNGTYTFTIKNKAGSTESQTIEINNILTGVITISATPTTITKDNVTITVTWPSGTSTATKQISTNGGTSWNTYTGDTSTVTVSSNCTIKARIKSGSEEIKTATLTVNNIDKNPPTVTAVQTSVTIHKYEYYDMSTYFTVKSNGKANISSIVYTDTSNNNAEVTNMTQNTLSKGIHVIKCTATKETGETASATISVLVDLVVPVYIDGNEILLTEENVKYYLGKVVQNYKYGSESTESITIGSENYTVSTKYRLYYVDFDGKYGQEGAVYLKAESVQDSEAILQADTTDLTNEAVKLRNLNPTSYASGQPQTPGSIDYLTFLTNSSNWVGLKDSNFDIEYVVGAPSLEMMIDSYNTYYDLNGDTPDTSVLSKNSDRVKLFYYPNNYGGYYVAPSVLPDGDVGENCDFTTFYSVKRDARIGDMYYTNGAEYFLASASYGYGIYNVGFYDTLVEAGYVNARDCGGNARICPVVCMSPFINPLYLTDDGVLWKNESGALDSGTFTVPDGVEVIEVSGYSSAGFEVGMQCGMITNASTSNNAQCFSSLVYSPGYAHINYIKVTPGDTYNITDYLKLSNVGYLMIMYSNEINNQTPDYDLTS